jgi:hypothetical protein
MRTLAFLCLFASVLPAQSRGNFEFRGMHLADSVTRDVERAQGLSCRDDLDRIKGLSYCVPANRDFVGGAAFIIVNLVDRRISSFYFSFDTDRFSAIALALETRWGAADSSKVLQVQNRMGANFENIVKQWVLADGNVELERYGSKVTEGTVTVNNVKLVTASGLRRVCAKAKAAQKDFGGKLPDGCEPF